MLVSDWVPGTTTTGVEDSRTTGVSAGEQSGVTVTVTVSVSEEWSH